jgi:hypothetical protein
MAGVQITQEQLSAAIAGDYHLRSGSLPESLQQSVAVAK